MKMISRTRNTSVSGVILISAKIDSPPPSSPTASSSGSFPIAIAVAFRALGEVPRLAVIALVVFALALAVGLGLAGGIEQQLEELVGEELHLGRDPVGPLAEEVEQDDRADGDADADRGDDQGLGDRA